MPFFTEQAILDLTAVNCQRLRVTTYVHKRLFQSAGTLSNRIQTPKGCGMTTLLSKPNASSLQLPSLRHWLVPSTSTDLKPRHPIGHVAEQPPRLRRQPQATPEAARPTTRIIPGEIGVLELLAAMGLSATDMGCDAAVTLPCETLHLDAGATVYEQGQHCGQAFVILNGVLERHHATGSRAQSMLGPGSVALSGARELLGLHVSLHGRPDTAVAVTKARVLAIPLRDLKALSPATTLINDLLMRTAGAALMRDWRVAYRLRDLPAFARTVAGLSHLAKLAEFKPQDLESDGTTSWLISEPHLASWLALDSEVLHAQLQKLERYGVMSLKAHGPGWLDPIKLDSLWLVD